MMFHVERIVSRPMMYGFLVPLVLIVCSCGISNPKYTISNYVTVPNAMDVLDNKGLTAFLFENNKQNLPFQQFITAKFPTDNYLQRQFSVTIDNQKFKLIVYDNDEVQKYINVSDFVLIHQNPDISNIGNQPDFIALSIIDSNNDDAIADQSLYQQTVLNFLQSLKDEYLQHD